MAFFAALSRDQFNETVAHAMRSRKWRRMREITDLTKWDGRPGAYVMVLDDYCQVYAGMTSAAGGVMGRIRQHWRNSKPFDRLLWGSADESVIAIDSFRALDTTRIFALESYAPVDLEFDLVSAFPPDFVLNRVPGGDPRLLGVLSAAGADVVKRRELS